MKKFFVTSGLGLRFCLGVLLWLGAGLAHGAECNPVAITALDQGWYDSSGGHSPANDNYFCGDGASSAPLRNWFVFNVPVLSQPITSVALRLNTFGIATSTGSEDYELREVTTPTATLRAGGVGLTNIYADLGDGTVYGSRTFLSTEGNQFITIPLNAAFVSAFTAAAGGTLALGGQLTSLDGVFNSEYLFGGSGSGSVSNPSVQLILTYSNGNVLSIVQDPVSLNLLAGSTANFQVQVCGGGPPAYQWQRFGTNLPGATSPFLQLTSVMPAQSGPYRAVVTDGLTTVTSAVATLTVSNGTPPSVGIYISYGQSPTLVGSSVSMCTSFINGQPTPSLQWQRNGTNLPGETTFCYSLVNAQTNQSGSYRVVASNIAGVFTSAPIALVVTQTAPTGSIYFSTGTTTPPAGSQVVLCSSIVGGPAPNFQWQFNGTNLSGQTGGCLFLYPVLSNNNGSYRIVASNVAGVFTSAPIALTVQYYAPTGFIYFSSGLSNSLAGSYVLLNSSISAAPSPSYQWQFNGTNLPGQINPYLELPNVSSNQAGPYRVVANNAAGSFTSAPIALTVSYQAPTGNIYLSTGSLPAPAGSQVTFCSTISAAPPATFQWRRDGVNLPGTTNGCLNLFNVSSNQAGLYRLIASNSVGIFTSAPIALAVTYAAPSVSIHFNAGQSPALAGSVVYLCSSIVAGPPLNYLQWQLNGTNLSGETGGCISLNNVSSNQAGSYRLIAGNTIGVTTSAPIVLDVSYIAPTATVYINTGHTPTTVSNAVQLCASVYGAPYPTVQWQFNGTNLSGEIYNCLYLSNLQTNQSGPYTIVASNSVGVVTSAVMVITVIEPPPVFAYLAYGEPPLQVGAYYYLGAETYQLGPVTLQWRFNGANVPEATNSYFYLYPVQANSGGNYTVVATTTNSVAYTSAPVAITVFFAAPYSANPYFSLGNPNSLVGEDVVLYASYGGSPSLIQWRFNGVKMPGETNGTLALLSVTTNRAGEYSFTATNVAGGTTSSVTTLTVGYQAPVIQANPTSLTVVEGGTARFVSYARGGPPPEYFLEKDGVNVAVPYTFESCCGASAGGFSLLDTTFPDAGNYRIIASNSLGTATSTVAVLTVTPAGPLDRWTQRNPLPQSQPLFHVAHGPNQFVAVGDRGTILTSPDGSNWALQNRRADLPLYGAAYGNGLYIAVGAGGTILSSSDGTNWSYRYTAAETTLNAATFADGAFVVVGTGPGFNTLIMRSEDAIHWTRIPINGQFAEQCVIHGHGRFIAAGTYSIMVSDDGLNWTLAQNIGHEVDGLAYADGQYVAVGDDGSMLASSDGMSWSPLTPLTTKRLTGVTYGAGRFVAAGARGTMLTSTDGYAWSTVSSGTPDRLETIDFSGGRFISAGENGTIITSTNGLNWTKQSIGVTRDFDGMHVANGRLIIVGKGGSIITSTDGEHYTTRDSGVTNDLHGITWGGGRWVAVGEPGIVLTSSNAVNWISHATGTTNSLKGATYADGQWIVVGTQGTVVRSTDGENWTTTFTTPNYDLNDVAFGNGVFLVAADGLYNQNGSVFQSADGITWTHVNFNPSKNLRGLTFINSLFLFTGNDGFAYTSEAGVTFNQVYVPLSGGNYNGNLRAATWAYGLWILVGNDGGIFSSPDLINWTRRATRTFENQHQVALLDGRLVVIGNRGGVLQSGRFVAEVEPPVFVPGAGFRLPFKGVLNHVYQIQASSNLLNWSNLLTFTNLTEQGSFTDTNSVGQPLRFYQLVEP